jgi:peptidoglycan/LPS O-acetylase OafA/YrhL
MKYTAWYLLVVGMLMFTQWAFFLLTGQVPELQTEPYRIAFHLAGEFLAAIVLILAGMGLLRGWRPARNLSLVALGMLFYTAIVSPGYFAQQGQWGLVAMFVMLLGLGVVGLRALVKEPTIFQSTKEVNG